MSREEEGEESGTLGELSEPIFDERGGFPPPAPGQMYEPGQALPPDMVYQNQVIEQAKGAPLGSSKAKTFVTTTFDARPINARDFLIGDLVAFSFSFAPPDPAIDLSFTVPPGYIGILRGFRWSFRASDLNAIAAPGGAGFVVSVLVDNTVQPDFDELGGLGPWLDTFFPTYVLADSNQTLTLRMTPFSNGDFALSSFVKMTIYGNVLLSRSLPLQFEPGSI